MTNKLGPYDLNTIITGDARELAEAIPDSSVDLIFTDPPYLKEYLYLYDWLGEVSKRILKPSGFLMTYAGGYWKDKVMGSLGHHLEYFWDYTMVMHDSSMMWPRKTIARAKSLLCYRPGAGTGLPRTNVLGLFSAGGKDKRFHEWGQDEETARYYIDCFSGVGDVIFEPFTGGGTTPVVCKALSRQFLGFEINQASAESSIERIAAMRQLITKPPLFIVQPEQTIMEFPA